MRLNKDRASFRSNSSNQNDNFLSSLHQQKEINKNLKERENREIKQQNDLWKLIFDATDFIKEKTMIQNDTMPLYDSFFKTEPSTFMSRPVFHECLMKILNKRSNKKEDYNDASKMMVKKEVTKLCKALDAKNKNKIDWRSFLYILNISINLHLTFSEQLDLGFRFFAIGCKNNDTSLSSAYKLDIKELPRLFNPLLQSEKLADSITKRFDEAWIKSLDTNNSMILSTNLNSGKTSYIAYQDFKSMLKQSVLHSYFEMVRFKGCLQTDIIMFSFEQSFYPDILLDGVYRIRESIEVTKLRKEKVKKLDHLRKYYTLKRWKEYSAQCRKLRILFDKCFQKYLEKMRVSFFAILINSIRIIAIADLQRMARGFLARFNASYLRKRHHSATMLQSLVKTYLAKAAYRNVLFARNWAATEIQRRTRAYIARKITMRRGLSFIATESKQLEMEKLRWETHLKDVSIRIIQRFYRYKKNKIITTEKYRRENKTKKTIEKEIEKYKQERKIYEMKVLELYEAQRVDYWKVTNRETKLQLDNGIDKTTKKKKKIEISNSATKNTSNNELIFSNINEREMIEKHCKDFQKYCIKCITTPDTPKERKFGMTIKKRIKERTNYVLKRADSNDIRMETSEAYDIAKEEVIHILCKEERNNKKEEIDANNAAVMKKAKEEKFKKDKEIYGWRKKMNKGEAALKIGLASRRWLAIIKIRRQFDEVYEKLFSEEYMEFYYKHKRTNEITWERPKVFGRFDISAKNEWKCLYDEQGFPYYFNPFTFQMTWEKPNGLNMCSETTTYYWWKIYPQPNGPCINFATRWGVSNQKFYCEQCWHNFCHKQNSSKGTFLFKRVKGAIPGSSKIKLDEILAEEETL